jgi:hypothetical protein
MNICINFFGQPRYVENAKYIYDNFMKDYRNNFHVLYTTWEHENIEAFEKDFPNAFIKKIKQPDESVFDKDIFENYVIDPTNAHRKQMSHYLYGLYIKAQTKNTILEYEKLHNIQFDIIITVRIYTKLKNPIIPYYEQIKNNDECVFVGNEELFNIYNSPSYPDTFVASNRRIGIDIVDSFDVLKKSTVHNSKMFHPETTSYNIIVNKGHKLHYISNFYAFVIE